VNGARFWYAVIACDDYRQSGPKSLANGISNSKSKQQAEKCNFNNLKIKSFGKRFSEFTTVNANGFQNENTSTRMIFELSYGRQNIEHDITSGIMYT